MTKQTEALKMAYDWLNEYAPPEVVQACKEALEQPVQEPVAVITPDNYGEPRLDFIVTFKYKATTAVNPDIFLYTHPAPSWQGLSDDEISHLKYLHVDYELFDEGEYGTECNVYVDDFARAIEQALKEKNNGSRT